jgi:hypothetical protein
MRERSAPENADEWEECIFCQTLESAPVKLIASNRFPMPLSAEGMRVTVASATDTNRGEFDTHATYTSCSL